MGGLGKEEVIFHFLPLSLIFLFSVEHEYLKVVKF